LQFKADVLASAYCPRYAGGMIHRLSDDQAQRHLREASEIFNSWHSDRDSTDRAFQRERRRNYPKAVSLLSTVIDTVNLRSCVQMTTGREPADVITVATQPHIVTRPYMLQPNTRLPLKSIFRLNDPEAEDGVMTYVGQKYYMAVIDIGRVLVEGGSLDVVEASSARIPQNVVMLTSSPQNRQ
jgi:hypothetical protein